MINLLPPDFKAELKASKTNSRLRSYVIISIVAVVLVGAMSAYTLLGLKQSQRQAQARADDNKHKVETLQKSNDMARDLARRVNAIGGLIDQKLSMSDIVVNIGRNTPQGAALTGLQLDVSDASKKPLTLIFGVDSKETAAVLRNNLAKDDSFFSGVSLTSLTAQNQNDSTGTSNETSRYPYVVILEVTLVSQKGNK